MKRYRTVRNSINNKIKSQRAIIDNIVYNRSDDEWFYARPLHAWLQTSCNRMSRINFQGGIRFRLLYLLATVPIALRPGTYRLTKKVNTTVR